MAARTKIRGFLQDGLRRRRRSNRWKLEKPKSQCRGCRVEDVEPGIWAFSSMFRVQAFHFATFFQCCLCSIGSPGQVWKARDRSPDLPQHHVAICHLAADSRLCVAGLMFVFVPPCLLLSWSHELQNILVLGARADIMNRFVFAGASLNFHSGPDPL